MIVCKFGGTSVGSAAAIDRLVSIIASRRSERPVVVVSAVAGVTDRLLGLERPLAAGGVAQARAGLDSLVADHRALADALRLPAEALEPIIRDAAALAPWLETRAGRPLQSAERDYLVAHGEAWSSRLVTAALGRSGLPGEWVDARGFMITDAQYTRARPLRSEIATRSRAVLVPLLESGRIPVTQGFIGASGDGTTTTLGRGGSDFTASLLGAALGVDRVEIWTDVDGIMTADPRIVPDARVLPVASHVEAAELATFGAKVLHPATQAPLVEARIPCVVLNSFAPERPGTTIVTGVRPAPLGDSPVRSISWKKGVTVLNIRAAEMLGSVGFLRRLFEVIERHGAAVDVVATSEINVSFTLEEASGVDALVTDLTRLGEVTIYRDRAIVAVVGTDLRGTRGLSARLFSAMRPVNIEMISQGASEINVTLVVKAEDGPQAVRLLHAEFFGAPA
jgi:aspartate kinase